LWQAKEAPLFGQKPREAKALFGVDRENLDGGCSWIFSVRRIHLKKANVARADTIRVINRQIVFNYVRERAPISRAEIARETSLQRSTVSYIVDELKDQNLIEEFGGESIMGRPPLLLQLRASDPIAIGIDLGFESTIVATGDLAGRVLDSEEFETNLSSKRMLNKIVASARRLIKKRSSIEGIGICLPGLVDPRRGSALFIPQLKWVNWLIGKELEEATGLPVSVDNNANAAALAELWFGGLENPARNFIIVLVSAGLGTGIVFDGQVYRGEFGAAGEFGHMTIGEDAPVACAIGNHGCWEAFASESAALARYANLSRGPNGHEIRFAQLVDRALRGEKAAKAALGETAHYLGVGISNIIKALSPEVVIVGGRIARAWPVIAGEIKATVQNTSISRNLAPTPIIPSTLGGNAKLMGALGLVLANKFTAGLAS
jgi:predicted NBD/HSP70 family sugar kinase